MHVTKIYRNTFSDDKIKTANTVFNDLLNDR